MALQTLTTQLAPDHAESAGALLVTMFQIAIATEAIVGSLVMFALERSSALRSKDVAA